MIDAGDVPGLIGGGLSLSTITGLVVARFIKRADETEEREVTAQVSTLAMMAAGIEALKSVLADVKSDVRLITAELHQARGEGSKTAERIDGISENHGERLQSLESRVTVMETKLSKARK